MGMFGNSASSGGRNFSDVLSIIGATLKDADPESQGGNLLRAQSMLGLRAQEARKQQFLGQLGGMLGPQYAEGSPAPTVAARGIIGGSAPSASLGDPSSALQTSMRDMAPGPAPEAPAPYEYKAPQRVSDGLSINSPQLPALTLMAQQAGVPIDDLIKVLTAQQPDVRFDRGFGYNGKTGAAMGGFHPDLDKGQTYENGQVRNLPGSVEAAAAMAGSVTGAQEKAKAGYIYPNARNQAAGSSEGSAPYDFISIPGPNGQPITISKSLARGGAFAGQTPADAAYAADTTKAVAAQYNGIQTQGQRATSSISNFNRINQLLDGLNTGRFTPAGKEVVSALSSLGIKPDPKWGNVEAADALSKKLALDAMGGSLGAGFSNADRSFVEGMNPSIVNTPQGRKQIVAFGIARAQRDQQIAQMARKWQERAGRLDKADRSGKTFFDYLDAYAAANPLVKQ